MKLIDYFIIALEALALVAFGFCIVYLAAALQGGAA